MISTPSIKYLVNATTIVTAVIPIAISSVLNTDWSVALFGWGALQACYGVTNFMIDTGMCAHDCCGCNCDATKNYTPGALIVKALTKCGAIQNESYEQIEVDQKHHLLCLC